MGESTERHLKGRAISREDQDAFAAYSHQRAAKAAERLADEITSVETRKGLIDADEGIRPESTAAGLAQLRPAFSENGTITAATASQISDGASALVLCRQVDRRSQRLVLDRRDPRVRHRGRARQLAARPARQRDRQGARDGRRRAADLDVVEMNEAFAAVVLASAETLGVDLNPRQPGRRRDRARPPDRRVRGASRPDPRPPARPRPVRCGGTVRRRRPGRRDRPQGSLMPVADLVAAARAGDRRATARLLTSRREPDRRRP